MDKPIDGFLFPSSQYHGDGGLTAIAISANLQEYSTRLGFVAALCSSGKLDTKAALLQVDELYSKFRSCAEQLSQSGL